MNERNPLSNLRLFEPLESEVVRAKLPPRAIQALFDATFGLQVRNSSYRLAVQATGDELSNQSATNNLKRIVSAGLLDKRGTKRGSHYVAAQPLLDIRQAHRTQRKPITFETLFDVDESND